VTNYMSYITILSKQDKGGPLLTHLRI